MKSELKSVERLGTIQNYVTRFFWSKFNPLPPLCHKLSHMAKPPYQQYVTGHNTPTLKGLNCMHDLTDLAL